MIVDDCSPAFRRHVQCLEIPSEEVVRRHRQKINTNFTKVVVVTPEDIRSLRRLPDGSLDETEIPEYFGCAKIEIGPDTYFVDPPPHEEMFITKNPYELLRYIGTRRIIIMSKETLIEQINPRLLRIGLPPFMKKRARFVAEAAESVGETLSSDLYKVGYEGGPSLDVPNSVRQVDPRFAVAWLIEVVSFILSVQDQQRLFSDVLDPPNIYQW